MDKLECQNRFKRATPTWPRAGLRDNASRGESKGETGLSCRRSRKGGIADSISSVSRS